MNLRCVLLYSVRWGFMVILLEEWEEMMQIQCDANR